MTVQRELQRGRRDGLLGAECWCHRTVVYLSVAEVRAGVTHSCGRTGCQGPT